MAKSDEMDWLRKRLDVIIQLLLETGPNGTASTTSKIERLLAMGFSQPEVAQVVGKKSNYVTAVVSAMKKKTSQKPGKKAQVTAAAPADGDA
jgi:hypothetical protein